MQRYKNYNRPFWIVLRSISTVTLTLGLLGIAGCGWLFSQPESPLSEEEARAILTTFEEASRLYEQLMKEGNADTARLVAEWLQNTPGIANARAEEDGSIYVIYDRGLTGLILSPYRTDIAEWAEGISVPTPLEEVDGQKVGCAFSNVPVATSPLSRNQKDKAIILAFDKDLYESNGGNKVKEDLEGWGYEVEVYWGKEFNLARVEKLDAYKIIVFITHGKAYPDSGVWLITGEDVTASNLSKTFKKEIAIASAPGKFKPKLRFNQDFITSKNMRFLDSLVIAMACDSFKEDHMAKAFCNHGAAAYLGWTGETTSSFSRAVLTQLFHRGLHSCGWSFSNALSARMRYPIGGRLVEASLKDMFSDPNQPPEVWVCYNPFFDSSTVVGWSLPALGLISQRSVPLDCLIFYAETPFLKWEAPKDLVLRYPEGACLSVSLPLSVPFEISPTEGPGWFYTITIREKNGIEVNLNRLQVEHYDIEERRLLAQWDGDEGVCRRIFKTDKLPPNGSISARVVEWPRPEYVPEFTIWKFWGIDSKGNHIEANNGVQLTQNAQRGLRVEISPPTLVGDKWQYEVLIFETRGSETNLMGISVTTFDEKLSTARYVGTSEDISKIFGSNTISGNGRMKAIVAQPYDPTDRSLAWVVAGVDKNGTMVYGSGVAELIRASTEASEKASDPNIKVIVPLAHSAKGVR